MLMLTAALMIAKAHLLAPKVSALVKPAPAPQIQVIETQGACSGMRIVVRAAARVARPR